MAGILAIILAGILAGVLYVLLKPFVCDCLNNGNCLKDGTCNCTSGYIGDKCQNCKFLLFVTLTSEQN